MLKKSSRNKWCDDVCQQGCDSPITYQGNLYYSIVPKIMVYWFKKNKKILWKKSYNYLKMCAGVDPSSSVEVLHIQDVMKIIQEQMELGFDIPLCIKIVIKD